MVCFHIITNHILGNVTQIFGVVQLLALAKPSKSIRLIAISEGLHWLVSRAFCFQFHAFFIHLSPHQFNIALRMSVKQWCIIFELPWT